MIGRTVWLLFFLIILPTVMLSQAKPCEFPDPIPFCIFAKALVMSNVAGTVSDKNRVEMPDGCIALFGKDKKPVVSAVTDQNGRFSLPTVPNGHYVFVASYIGFSPAMIEINIDQKRGTSKKIRVEMTLSEIDTCSWVGLKR